MQLSQAQLVDLHRKSSEYAKIIDDKLTTCKTTMKQTKVKVEEAKGFRNDLFSLGNHTHKQVHIANTLFSKLQNIINANSDKLHEFERGMEAANESVKAIFRKLQLKTIDTTLPIQLPPIQSNSPSCTLFQFVDVNSVSTLSNKIHLLIQNLSNQIKDEQLKLGLERLKFRKITKMVEKTRSIEGTENFFAKEVSKSQVSSLENSIISQNQFFSILASNVTSFFSTHDKIGLLIQKLEREEEVHEMERIKLEESINDKSMKLLLDTITQNSNQIVRYHNGVEEIYSKLKSILSNFYSIYKSCVKLQTNLESISSSLVTHSQKFQEGTDELIKLFDELENLVNWYEMFYTSYEELKNEMKRRKEEEMKHERIRQKIAKEFELLYFEECYKRQTFYENFGVYLPSTFCPQIVELPNLFTITAQNPSPDQQGDQKVDFS